MTNAKKCMTWVLIFSLLCGTGAPATLAQTNSSDLNSRSPQASDQAFSSAVSSVLSDPFLVELEKNLGPQFNSIEEVVGELDAQSFDENPFFLRGQRWLTEPSEENVLPQDHSNQDPTSDESYLLQSRTHARTALLLPHSLVTNPSRKTLEIPERFNALFESDEFLFLTRNQADEGVFFISRSQLQKAAAAQTTVPIFFLPVPGLQSDKVNMTELPELERLVIRWENLPSNHMEPDQAEPFFSIPVEDLQEIAKAQDLNLKIAVMAAAANGSNDGLPAPRSTALHGLVYTGQEVMARRYSMIKELAPILESLSGLSSWAVLSAHAQDPALPLAIPAPPIGAARGLPPGLHSRLIRFAVVCAVATVSAIILKHTRYRAYFKQRNQAEEERYLASCEGSLGNSASGSGENHSTESASSTQASEASRGQGTSSNDDSTIASTSTEASSVVKPSTPTGRRGLWNNFTAWLRHNIVAPVYKFKPVRVVHREVRDTVTVTSTMLWTLWGLPTVWVANAVEFLGDRFAPSLFAGERSPLRKFLSNTLYWSRSAVDNITPNAYTWAMGLTYGSVDTATYYIQLYSVNEVIARTLATQFPIIESRVNHAFGSENTALEQNRVAEIVKCGIYYGNSGAAVFSQGWRAQLLQTAELEVADNMRAQGRNPFDPHFQGEFRQLVEARLAAVMQEQGLPGPEDFLFDASSFYDALMRTLGYRLPKDFTPAKDATYWATERPGLINPAVEKAADYAALKAEDVMTTSTDGRAYTASVKLLEHLRSNLRVTHQFLGKPSQILLDRKLSLREKIAAMKRGIMESAPAIWRTRQELLFLTVSKDEHLAQNLMQHPIPKEWIDFLMADGYSSDEAKRAIHLSIHHFRNAMMALMTGDETRLGATRSMRKRFSAKASEITAREFLTTHSDAFNHLQDQGLSPENAFTALYQNHKKSYGAALEDNIITLAQDHYALSTNKIYDGYRPPQMGDVAKWQLRRAEQKARTRFFAEFGREYDEYASSDASETTLETRTNERELENRAQWIFAESLMSVVGLHPDWSEDPQLKERVLQASLQNFEDLRRTDPNIDAHLAELSPWQRAKLKREIFADFAVRNYLTMTITDPKFPALSVNQPGRLQKFRQWKIVKNSKVLTRTARAIEAIVGPTSFGLGLSSMVDRNIPLVYYFRAANGRAWRGSVVSALAITPFNALLYGVWVAPYIWTWNLLTKFLVSGPEQAMNNLFRMQGLRPMASLPTMLLYSNIFAWGTFWGTVPTQIFQEDFSKLWRMFDHLTPPGLTDDDIVLKARH